MATFNSLSTAHQIQALTSRNVPDLALPTAYEAEKMIDKIGSQLSLLRLRPKLENDPKSAKY